MKRKRREIIADQIKIAMDKQGLSKTAMAARMNTSRRQLDRLLGPDNQYRRYREQVSILIPWRKSA